MAARPKHSPDLTNGLAPTRQVMEHILGYHEIETSSPWISNPAAMDGTDMVQWPVAPGETFTYRFRVPDAGTFWYHPHSNETVQLEMGL